MGDALYFILHILIKLILISVFTNLILNTYNHKIIKLIQYDTIQEIYKVRLGYLVSVCTICLCITIILYM